jgi:hypothetical protein
MQGCANREQCPGDRIGEKRGVGEGVQDQSREGGQDGNSGDDRDIVRGGPAAGDSGDEAP